jgi:tetratricopeptide (TPR) repeat protein
MKKLVVSLLMVLALTATAALGQSVPVAPVPQASAPASELDRRAEAYYHFAMGKLFEEYYEATSQSEYATQAIEHYKKAYALDPRAAVIGERLAEMYAKAQRIRDAVLEAEEILRRDPDNLPARRLLGRIYLRTLGDLNPSLGQREIVNRAIEQYREILRLDPGDAEAAHWLARLYRLQNEHGKAEEVLRGVLEREPENEQALEQLAQLLLDLGKADDAVQVLEKVAERSPTGRLLGLLGDAYSQVRQYAKAEATYRRATELEPGELAHPRGLARALHAQDKLDEAVEQYQRLSQMEPENPENYLRAAQILRQLKRLEAAEDSLLRAKQHAPGNLEVLYSEALLYEAQGRFEDAVRVLSDAVARLKAQPGRVADSRRTLAVLYEQLGRLYRETSSFDAALATFREMLALGPEEQKRGRVMLADTYRVSRQIEKAVEESRRAAELYPQDRGVQVNYALLLGEQGKVDEAVAILRGMLDGSGSDREIHLSLAQAYERARRYPEAEQSARAAEKMAGRPAENEMVWFLLGAIYERQKRFDLAEEQFRKALDLNPRNAGVLNYYGYMLADQGIRLDEAVELVKRALEEDAHNGAYLDSLGWVYFHQGRLKEAEEYLRRAVARSPSDPTIREHLGDVLFQTGRNDQAAAEWERSLAEWRRVLPSEYESEKVVALEKKLASLKHRLAQQKSGGGARPE